MRPTAFTCPAPAIPATSVPKISGAMIILISRRNSWLNGLKYWAHSGCVRLTSVPATTPTMRPRMICWVSVRPERAGVWAERAGDIGRFYPERSGPDDRSAGLRRSAGHSREHGARSRLCGGGADAVPAGRLGGVQRAIRALQQRVGILACHRRGDPHADGGREARVASGHFDLFDLAAHPLRDAGRAGRRRFRQHDEEFVAAVTAAKVAAPQDLAEALPDRGQDFVAAQVAVPVVDALELVDVEHHDRQRGFAAARARDLHFERVQTVRAVETSRQRVAQAVVAHFREELHVMERDAEPVSYTHLRAH